MIESLYINNFAIIKELKINFHKGFNIFSGETGAGKSIIVESIGFLFGSKYYGDIEKPVVVSGVFRIDKDTAKKLLVDEVFEIKKIIEPNGKSKYYFNSKITSFSFISGLASYLLDFHAQMENLLITSIEKQIEILDNYASNQKLVKEYRKLYDKKKDIEMKIKSISMNEDERKRLVEIYDYQLKELEEANIKENEDIELEEIILKIKNISKVKNIFEQIYSSLISDGGIKDKITKAGSKFEELSKIDANFLGLSSRLDGIIKELEIFEEEIKDASLKYNIKDEEIDEYIKRDELLKRLKKKYATDLKGLIMKKEELRKNLEALKNYEYNTETLNKELEEIIVEMDKIAKKLDKNRKIASNKMSEEVLNELKKLGFEHPRFSINVSESEEFNQYGKNSVEFLFSANPDTLLKPLRYVASGGEISRIMLSIKKVSNEKNSSTLIFDEIDSGIGGNTAFYVGECLKEISKNKQLLVITHIPQVAVFGDMHFKVEKNYENKKTNVVVKTLINKNERVNEIARMLGSIYSPDTAIKHAEELLKKANT